MTGYDELRSGAAWLDLSTRGKIRVTGEDRARLLHAMTTNQVEKLQPGEGCYAYFLSVQGRILADVNVLCRPDSLLLDTEPETREKIFQHLDKFIIADDVTLEDLTDSTATITLEGPTAEAVLQKAGAPVPSGELANELWGNTIIARITTTGIGGFLLIAPLEEKAAVIHSLEDAGALPGSAEAFRAVRLEHGKPRYGEDLTERFLSQEANQQHALNFSKGCYLGQEIVERVRSRGQVHRLLMPLEIEGSAVPEPGTKIQQDAANVAEITSAAFSPALQKVVALAYVRMDKARPGVELKLEDRVVRVVNTHSSADSPRPA